MPECHQQVMTMWKQNFASLHCVAKSESTQFLRGAHWQQKEKRDSRTSYLTTHKGQLRGEMNVSEQLKSMFPMRSKQHDSLQTLQHLHWPPCCAWCFFWSFCRCNLSLEFLMMSWVCSAQSDHGRPGPSFMLGFFFRGTMSVITWPNNLFLAICILTLCAHSSIDSQW